jgi:NADH:ubiquinone oxidoreductase subunit 6 (subunit J)
VFTVSLNERCTIHCDFRFHARRGTGGRDVAKSHARRVLPGAGVARAGIFLFPARCVGLALVFIYIGAVAVLIVFTILLTRRDSKEHYSLNWGGVFIALVVFGALTWAVLKTPSLSIVPPHARVLTVKRIGETLMTGYVWPLQCVGLLLTAALIGALVLVMEEKR